MIKTSQQLSEVLLKKMEDVAEGKNLAGADTLCRLTETYIKLKTLEMQYAVARKCMPELPDMPQVKVIENSADLTPARRTPSAR